jgi:hypothetical protein
LGKEYRNCLYLQFLLFYFSNCLPCNFLFSYIT